MAETVPGLAEATDAERTRTLRERCRARKTLVRQTRNVALARSLRATERVESWQIRQGTATRDVLSAVRFAVDDLELLVGRPAPEPAGAAAEAADADAYLWQFPYVGGQRGHCQLDLSRLFDLGIDGMLADLRQRAADAEGERRDALESFATALSGLSVMAENAAGTVEEAMPDASPARLAELEAMAASCRRVAHGLPVDFRDAIQLVWFATFGVMWGEDVFMAVPGRLDRVLAPYYDPARRVEALVLIEGLYLLVNEYIADGLAMSVMVGGRDAEGGDTTNELSYLCLEALRRTRLIFPTVGVCRHEGTPRDLIDLAVELIADGVSTPAFFNDETIQRGLADLGVPAEDRCDYVNSTCVEITPVGASNVWVASPYYALPTILLEELAAQVEGGAPATGFDEFVAAFGARLGRHVTEGVAQQNAFREERRLRGRKPLQSVFTRDCTERARDIDDGGALYNWVECSFVGIANLVDSLHVIRREVYETGRLSLAELKAVLDADFEGREPVRQRFLNEHAKYGNDAPEVDELVARVADMCVAECRRHRMLPDDSPYVPGAFCWVMHEQLGAEAGATPDGRRAATAFADGGGPAQGRERCGPTAAVLSTTSWDHSPLLGGLAYNMKFRASLLRGAEGRQRLRELIETYLRRGGFETQVNVVDTDTLRRARQDPERHADLLVRIGGYCDYFTRLSPGMQDEIIRRTEFTSV